ncbi:MAG: holdfast anchoring protein HfaA [Hyphomonadaceae bacterium]
MRFGTFTIVLAAFATAAAADPIPSGTSDVERAFGMGWDSFDAPINPATRDASGNRVVVNGRIELEGTLSGGLMDDYATGQSAQAIGNQLNVVTQGNYNTVIVNANQTNYGDISADTDGE